MTGSPLVGQSIAITGGGNGIGKALAQHFVRAGAKVALGDIDIAAVEAVAAELGGDTVGLPLDVADRDAFEAFLTAAEERHGPLDTLVNNAGIDWIGPFHEEPHEVTRREIEVNLLGSINGTWLAMQRMLPQRQGRIVNVASGVGRVPLPGSAVYAATKHGIVGLTESLRLEYRGSGVNFTLIQPAQVKTAMLAGQAQPRLLAVVTADDVAAATVDAVVKNRFEVWVPSSQGVTAKLGLMMPRPVREALLRLSGVGRITGDTDQAARRDYHERMFNSQ
jgi:NAD(P)-dependent dehydrogenase (short-subunit alcohol dehydrogenase family)